MQNADKRKSKIENRKKKVVRRREEVGVYIPASNVRVVNVNPRKLSINFYVYRYDVMNRNYGTRDMHNTLPKQTKLV